MTDLKAERKAIVLPGAPIGARNLFHAPHPEQRLTLCGQEVPTSAHVITLAEATGHGGIPCPLCLAVVKSQEQA